MFVQMIKIIALNQLIRKLRKRHAFAIARQSFLNRILRHHIIDGDSFADFTREIDKGKRLHPIVIVDENRSVFFGRIEIDKPRQHSFDAFYIVV